MEKKYNQIRMLTNTKKRTSMSKKNLMTKNFRQRFSCIKSPPKNIIVSYKLHIARTSKWPKESPPRGKKEKYDQISNISVIIPKFWQQVSKFEKKK